jgi:hypothetical protein
MPADARLTRACLSQDTRRDSKGSLAKGLRHRWTLRRGNPLNLIRIVPA